MSSQKPSFLIIGTQKGGTTSLYQYLLQHPQMLAAQQKEIHFFDLKYELGDGWYLSQFPLLKPTIPTTIIPKSSQDSITKTREKYSTDDHADLTSNVTLKTDISVITGEASPYYLLHPLVPKRVASFNAAFKLIILLRDPVDRALSHYYHEVRLGFESLTLAEAIAQEPDRLAGELEKFATDPHYQSYPLQHYSYVLRGIYVDQLQQWQRYFPCQQILILNSEKFYEFPQLAMDRVTDFLGISRWEFQDFQPFNSGSYSRTDQDSEVEKIKADLKDQFLTHNLRLWDYLNVHFPKTLDTEFRQGICW